MSKPLAPNEAWVKLTHNQIRHLVEAAGSAIEIYRDSDDTPAEFHLQKKARSLEQAIVRLGKVDLDGSP